jgi:nitroreductase/NAD-dependent dihydropyrimidine dehydrogenase PreA subunit
MDQIIVDENLCTGCESCVEVCPRDSLGLNKEGFIVMVNERCHSCGHCISVCPENALSHKDFPFEEYELINDHLDSSLQNGIQLVNLLKSIRSTRKYLEKPIEKPILQNLIDVTRYAPTGHHTQSVQITAISDPVILQQLKTESEIVARDFIKKSDSKLFGFLAKLTGKGESYKKLIGTRSRFVRQVAGFEKGIDYLFHGAPTVVVFHANKKSYVPEDNCNQAAAYYRVAAEGYGLGTSYIGYLVYYAKYNPKIREILEIPKENEIYLVLIVGYPKHKFRRFVARNPSNSVVK